MKKKVFYVMALCIGLFSSCDKDNIGFEEPIVPPIEKPEKPSITPSIDDLIRVKIDDDIMAIVGSNSWRSVTKGEGKYVAVGENGYITYSTDGENWSTPKQVGTNNWNHVAYGNGKYMVVGDGGYISLSTDGVNWATPTTLLFNNYPITSTLIYVIYADGKFVAEREGASVVFISSDGSTWDDSGDVFMISDKQCRGIAYGDGKFVAFGAQNSLGAEVSTSTDGVKWNQNAAQLYAAPIYDVAYGNGKFVAVGGDYAVTSTDGVKWKREVFVDREEYPNLKCITFHDGYFITCGGEGWIYISNDGIKWTKVNNSDSTWINSVCGV